MKKQTLYREWQHQLGAARLVMAVWGLRLALDISSQWYPDRPTERTDTSDETELPGRRPFRPLQLPTMRVLDFSKAAEGPPLLVCAPYALHRAKIADLAHGHSLMEALQEAGIARLYLTDWRSATPEMRYFSIDTFSVRSQRRRRHHSGHRSTSQVSVRAAGCRCSMLRVFPARCGGSCLQAVRSTSRNHRIVLSRMVASLPQQGFEAMVRQGHGIVSGEHMLQVWSARSTCSTWRPRCSWLLDGGSEDARFLLDRFRCALER